MLRPKSKVSGIMVSDFVDEINGYLSLTKAEHEQASRANPRLKRSPHQYLEYSESREGYWTSDKFTAQMEIAAAISEVKYPREKGWKLVWVFNPVYTTPLIWIQIHLAGSGSGNWQMRTLIWIGIWVDYSNFDKWLSVSTS